MVGRTAAVAAALAVAVSLSACGSSGGGGQLSAGGPQVKALSAAAAKTDGLDTATWKLAAADSQNSTNDETITGSVDRTRQLAEADSTSGFQGARKERLVIAGDTVYLTGANLAAEFNVSTPWVSGDVAVWRKYDVFTAEADPFVAFSANGDPLDGIMVFLQTISSGVSEVGSETVDGVATTHYHADVPLQSVEAAIARKLSETVGTDGGETVDTTPGTLHVDVWIDAGGLIRRLVATGPSGDSSSASGGGTTSSTTSSDTATLTFDLLDVGSPVDITVPPADQVTKVDLSKLFGSTIPATATTSLPGSTTTTS
jgi:hypothetical protein